MDMDLIYGILAAIGLSMTIMFFQGIRRKRSWQGVVTKIKEIEDADENLSYKIYYRTDSGKRANFKVRQDYYDLYYSGLLKVGSKLSKEAGKDYPRAVVSV